MKPILYEEVGVELQEGIDYRVLRIREPLPIVEPPKVKTDALSYGGGYTCFFYKVFGCFSKKICIDSQYYHIIFNRYIYTVDGKQCEGIYNPKMPNKIDWFYDLEEYDPDYIYCAPCLLYRIVFYKSY